MNTVRLRPTTDTWISKSQVLRLLANIFSKSFSLLIRNLSQSTNLAWLALMCLCVTGNLMQGEWNRWKEKDFTIVFDVDLRVLKFFRRMDIVWIVLEFEKLKAQRILKGTGKWNIDHDFQIKQAYRIIFYQEGSNEEDFNQSQKVGFEYSFYGAQDLVHGGTNEIWRKSEFRKWNQDYYNGQEVLLWNLNGFT